MAASPALVFTSEETWQHHPSLVEEAESVHLTTWPEDTSDHDESTWQFLVGIREAVNAVLEPLRAEKTLAATLEADVRLELSPEDAGRLEPFRAELSGFLLVAAVEVVTGIPGQEPAVTAAKTAYGRCERCWTYRADVAPAEGGDALCGRCTAVLTAREGSAQA